MDLWSRLGLGPTFGGLPEETSRTSAAASGPPLGGAESTFGDPRPDTLRDAAHGLVGEVPLALGFALRPRAEGL